MKAEGPPLDFHPSAFVFLPSKCVKWTCKPNSVPRAGALGEDHSSATRVTAVVKQPTRKLITETGGSMTSLFGLAPQGVCRAAHTRVGRGALLPHRFTLASSSCLAARGDRRSILCCTFRRVAAPGRYPACCP